MSGLWKLKDLENPNFVAIDTHLMFEKSEEARRRVAEFQATSERKTKQGATPPRSSTGAVVKSSLYYPVGSGFLLIALSSVLWGQMPGPGQAARGTSAVAIAPSPTQHPAPSDSKSSDDNFVIGNGDVLAINVWKEPDFSSRSTQVRSDGKISLPLVGEVPAAGMTPSQLEEDLAVKLRNYITKPQVTVMVEQINSKKFNILGQVAKPGSYSLALAPTIVDAIAIAGGPRDFAKQKSIYIIREDLHGGQTRIAFNYKDFLKGKNQNVKLEPRDTIVVP